ncbi:unnamed protein product, partial [marine sediment metagenome]
EHHKQIRNATMEEFTITRKCRLVSIYGSFCGLCQRYTCISGHCGDCPLYEDNEDNDDTTCCVEWNNLDGVVNRINWEKVDETDWKKVQECEDALIARLESLL